MKTTRRGLFGILMGAVAAPFVAKAIGSPIPKVKTRTIGVDFIVPSTDATLSMDDFSQRYLEPFMSSIANRLDADAGRHRIVSLDLPKGLPVSRHIPFRGGTARHVAHYDLYHDEFFHRIEIGVESFA